MSFIRAFIFDNVQIQISNDQLAFNDRPAPKPPSDNNNVHAHQSLIKSNGLPDIEKAESAMDQCHCCKQWFFRIEAHYIEGAFFQIKMTPNQIIMTAYEEDAFLIIFLRFDSNSLTRIKSANLG
jgi:hypothetical protein